MLQRNEQSQIGGYGRKEVSKLDGCAVVCSRGTCLVIKQQTGKANLSVYSLWVKTEQERVHTNTYRQSVSHLATVLMLSTDLLHQVLTEEDEFLVVVEHATRIGGKDGGRYFVLFSQNAKSKAKRLNVQHMYIR